jgi:hypothetical protein
LSHRHAHLRCHRPFAVEPPIVRLRPQPNVRLSAGEVVAEREPAPGRPQQVPLTTRPDVRMCVSFKGRQARRAISVRSARFHSRESPRGSPAPTPTTDEGPPPHHKTEAPAAEQRGRTPPRSSPVVVDHRLSGPTSWNAPSVLCRWCRPPPVSTTRPLARRRSRTAGRLEGETPRLRPLRGYAGFIPYVQGDQTLSGKALPSAGRLGRAVLHVSVPRVTARAKAVPQDEPAAVRRRPPWTSSGLRPTTSRKRIPSWDDIAGKAGVIGVVRRAAPSASNSGQPGPTDQREPVEAGSAGRSPASWPSALAAVLAGPR